MKKSLRLKIASLAGATFFMSAATLPMIELGDIRVVGNLAYAQEPTIKLPGCKAPPEKRRLKSLDQKFFKRVASVDERLNPEVNEKTGKAPEPNYRAAWAELKKLLDRCEGCNEYEMAQLYQRAAVIHYNLEDVPKAIDYFKQVISKSPNIPESLEATLTYQVAQLVTSEERYEEALRMFDQWESLCPTVIPSDYFYFRAQNLFLLDRKDEALQQINRAIKMAEDKGETPREAWYRLQLAIFVDKEDYKAAERVAEQLVSKYFNSRVLAQLASLYGMNGKEQKQMAAMDALRTGNAMDKESQYKNLAYLYLGAEVPYLASKVMKEGIQSKTVERNSKNLEVWAVSLSQAHEVEQALPIMEEAAKKADDGKLFATLAAIYLDAEKFEQAVTSGKKALNKGGLRNDSEVNMYLGSAYMQLERYDDAINVLNKARKDDKYGKYAEDLIKYVKREQQRDKELREAKLKL